MKCGISTYTYTWAIGVPGSLPANPMTVFNLIDKAKELGADCVQIADNLPLDQLSTEEIKAIFEYASIRSISLEPGMRGLTPKNLEKYISIAQTFQSPVLRAVIDATGFEPEIKEITAIIKDYLPTLKKLNVILAIENHDRLKAREFVEIIESTSKTHVGICLDSVNSMGAGEGLETIISHLAPYTVNLHVKEFTVRRIWHKMGFEIEGLPLGKGMLPLKEMINVINKPWISAILEQWTPPEKEIEKTIEKEDSWAIESFQLLKKIVNESGIKERQGNTVLS